MLGSRWKHSVSQFVRKRDSSWYCNLSVGSVLHWVGGTLCLCNMIVTCSRRIQIHHLIFFLVQCWNAILSDSCFYSTKKASHIVGKRLNKMKFKASMHLTGTSPILSFTCFWYASRDSTIQMFLQKRSPVRNSDWSSHHCGILGGFWRIRESTPSLTKVSLLWSYVQWVGCCLTSHVQRSPTCFCSQWSCDPYSWGQKRVILLIQYATGCRFVRWEGLEVLGFGLYMKLC